MTEEIKKLQTTQRQNHIVDPQAGLDFLTRARLIAKHREDRWTKLITNWNPAISTQQKGYEKQGRPAKRWEDDLNAYPQPTRYNRDDNDLTSDTTWLPRRKTARNRTLWEVTSQAADSNNQHDPGPQQPRLRQPNLQHTTKQQIRQKLTTNTKKTPKTTTSKTTTIRYSSSLTQLIGS